MEPELLEEIVACLPRGRTPFPYFKDRYAFQLLADHVGAGRRIADVRQGPYASLLQKPSVKSFIGQCGVSMIDRVSLALAWDEPSVTYLLTLGRWQGRSISAYSQVSRKGDNLVLRLHFPASHDRAVKSLLGVKNDYALACTSHPILLRGERELFRETLAWARIDLDFETGEALIEELQSDWVRYARYLEGRVRKALSAGRKKLFFAGSWIKADKARAYLQLLEPYARLWEEAMLSAAIAFIRHELGIHRIYMHEWISGGKVKHIIGVQPPRRIYTSLPRKFCFAATAQTPAFLADDRRFVRRLRKARITPAWQLLAA